MTLQKEVHLTFGVSVILCFSASWFKNHQRWLRHQVNHHQSKCVTFGTWYQKWCFNWPCSLLTRREALGESVSLTFQMVPADSRHQRHLLLHNVINKCGFYTVLGDNTCFCRTRRSTKRISPTSNPSTSLWPKLRFCSSAHLVPGSPALSILSSPYLESASAIRLTAATRPQGWDFLIEHYRKFKFKPVLTISYIRTLLSSSLTTSFAATR